MTTILVLLWAPGAALAHSPITGSSGFYSGVLHPVVTPAELMVLAGLGLWLGGHGKRQISKAVGGFGLFLVIGTVIGLLRPQDDPSMVLLGCALVLGLLIAARRCPPWPAAPPLAATIVGFFLGADLAPDEPAVSLAGSIMAFLGSLVGSHLLLLNLVAIAASFQNGWPSTAIRIAGSWIAASALLVLALAVRNASGS